MQIYAKENCVQDVEFVTSGISHKISYSRYYSASMVHCRCFRVWGRLQVPRNFAFYGCSGYDTALMVRYTHFSFMSDKNMTSSMERFYFTNRINSS